MSSFWSADRTQELKSGLWSLMAKVQETAKDIGGKVQSTAREVGEKVVAFAAGEPTPDELGLLYITPQLVAMPFPSSRAALGVVSIDSVSHWLHTKHSGRFMVWNLADKSFAYSKFDDQVIEFKFPGYPAPPLDKIFAICKSIDAWLRADPANVAVVNCQTGRGRTLAAIACYLAWTKGFGSADAAMRHIASKKKVDVSELLIPTQIRYLGYFDRLLSKSYPCAKPVMLERIIINTIPNYVKNNTDKEGCRPYLQIFKYANVIHTSLEKGKLVKWYREEDETILFKVNIIVQGDVLVRVRHIENKTSRVTMFRTGFHTGYVSPGIVRLNPGEIDGIEGNKSYSPLFFVDLIFAPVPDEKDADNSSAYADSDQYWETVMYREPPKEKPEPVSPTKIQKKFVFFEQENSVDSTHFSPTGEDKPKTGLSVDEKKDGFEELEKYVQGIDDLNAEDFDVDADADDLLDKLQKEMEEEGDLDSPKITSDDDAELEKEVNAILNKE